MAIVVLIEPCRFHGDKYCRLPECDPKVTYSREQVENLLTAKFNGGVYFREEKPEPDMAWRKAPNTDPKRATDTWAEMCDINRAWDYAELDPRHRTAVWLHYGHGWTQKQIGLQMQVDQTTAGAWLYTAVGQLAKTINKGETDG